MSYLIVEIWNEDILIVGMLFGYLIDEIVIAVITDAQHHVRLDRDGATLLRSRMSFWNVR